MGTHATLKNKVIRLEGIGREYNRPALLTKTPAQMIQRRNSFPGKLGNRQFAGIIEIILDHVDHDQSRLFFRLQLIYSSFAFDTLNERKELI
jgi:hypothetical protein